MTILVTGGCGFIGSNFIHRVLETTNETVINVDSLTYAGNESNHQENSRYKLYKTDINGKNVIKTIINEHKPWAIVHFAAESHVDNSIKDSSPFLHSNVMGTVSLLEVIRKYSPEIRFVHVSTDEVYGSLNVGDPAFTETTGYDPRSPYSASKAASDHFVNAYHHTHKLNTVITNCSNNYGPYQYPEKFIPVIISKALRNEKIPVYGAGANIRDWLYVRDHCDAILRVMVDGKSGEKYNIGGNNEHTNLMVVGKILTILDKKLDLISFVEDRKGHDFRYSIDNTKIKKELGWEPSVSFDDGLYNTVKWYIDNQNWLNMVINNGKNFRDNSSRRKI